MIDLHSHLLPGIDDGCQSVRESLECVRQLAAAGFRGSVCTPHFDREIYPGNQPAEIATRVARLQAECDEAGLEYRLWPGAELRISASAIAWCEEVGVPTLGSSRVVLVDYWGRFWPDFAAEVFDYLLERDYEVLLAHPERLELMVGDVEAIVLGLQERGIKLQGNLASLGGGEGATAERLSRNWLAEGRYSVLGTDTHNPWGIERRLAGLAAVDAVVGEQARGRLLCAEPCRVLGWESPTSESIT